MIPTIGRWAQAPDLIEPIVGYRGWRYTTTDRGVDLFAIGRMPDWSLAKSDWEGACSSWVTASCRYVLEPTHVAPDEDCTCGYYAARSADDVAMFGIAGDPQAADDLEDEGADGTVLGRVLLAGKVIEHAYGYRAERARIAELIPTTLDGGITRALASRLELPVGPTMDLSSLLGEIEEARSNWIVPLPCPSLIDRLRLRRHLRRFSLIHGDAANDREAQSPRPFNPRPFSPPGDPSPPAA